MITRLSALDVLHSFEQWLLVDVRSPSEFERAHIPGATNLPLFSDEERARVGLCYKTEGREQATLLGLELVGPKMRQLGETMLSLAQEKPLLFCCWRGGMRSQSMAWLAAQVGLRVGRLLGGYKAFRRVILDGLEQTRPVVILGGKTGSGKTKILQALRERGEVVLDLEHHAHHKGSSFGSLGEQPQPTQPQFENAIGLEWLQADEHTVVWLENESRCVGKRTIPKALWMQMRQAPVIDLQVPKSHRIDILMEDYGSLPLEGLEDAVHRIGKRLGPQHLKDALDSLHQNNLQDCCSILLDHYYDKMYGRGLSKREAPVFLLSHDTQDMDTVVSDLLQLKKKIVATPAMEGHSEPNPPMQPEGR